MIVHIHKVILQILTINKLKFNQLKEEIIGNFLFSQVNFNNRIFKLMKRNSLKADIFV